MHSHQVVHLSCDERNPTNTQEFVSFPLGHQLVEEERFVALSQRPSKAGRCVWPMRPWSPCFFPGSWCTWVECALRMQSLHFPSSVECLQSSPAGFQRQMLWGLFFLLPDPPGCAAWHGALNSDSCRRTSAIYYSPVYGPLPGCQGCDYIVSAHLLSSRCGFFFMSLDVDYLFLLLLDSSLFNRWFFSS